MPTDPQSPSDLDEQFLSRETLVEGILLTVHRDTVRLPDGETSRREWIEHPGAAAVVPLLPDGRVVLVRQFRYPPRREFLEVPAGKLDHDGEAPAELAKRELQEEAGYAAGRLTPLGKTYPCIGYANEVIHLFLAEDLTESSLEAEDDEFVEPVALPFDEVVAMAERGELLDAKTEVAVLRARAELARRGAGG